MAWSLWGGKSDHGLHDGGNIYSKRSSLTSKNSVLDTVDSFKLEPSSKARQGSHELGMWTNQRQSQPHMQIPARFSSMRLSKRNASTATFFEPSSITEYKRLRYITNRDFHRKQSVMPKHMLGAKSGFYDKHCVFVSVTGITIKLNLGQRRPVDAATGPRLTWSSLRGKDRVPRYASNVSYFSIRMSELSQVGGATWRPTLTNDLASYISKDKKIQKTSVDIYGEKTLRKSLELQANTLDNHFGSAENLNSSELRLSFVWEEMGLSLQPLANTNTSTSLYEVLTKDQVQPKKDAPTVIESRPAAYKTLNDTGTVPTHGEPKRKTSKSRHEKKRYSFGSDSSGQQDSPDSKEPIKTKQTRTRKSRNLSDTISDLATPNKKTFLQVPKKTNKKLNKPDGLSETSSEDSIHAEPQRATSKDHLDITRRSSSMEKMETNFPETPEISRDYTMGSKHVVSAAEKVSVAPSTTSDNDERAGDLSKPKAEPESMATVESDRAEKFDAHSSLPSESKQKEQPRNFSDSELAISPRPPLNMSPILSPSDHKPPLSSRTPSDYKSPFSSRTPSDYKSPFSSRTPSDYKSPLSPRTPSDYRPIASLRPSIHYRSAVPSRVPSDYRSGVSQEGSSATYSRSTSDISWMQSSTHSSSTQSHEPTSLTTPDTLGDQSSVSQSRTPTDHEAARPLRIPTHILISSSEEEETLFEEYQPSRTTNTGELHGSDWQEEFYDCLPYEGTNSSPEEARRGRRRYASRISASLRRAVGWVFQQIIGKSDRDKGVDNGDDSSTENETIYFSPRNSSLPDLNTLVFDKSGRDKHATDAKNSNVEDVAIYFDPRGSSEVNMSNSNSAPQIRTLYCELQKIPMELKELRAENKKFKDWTKADWSQVLKERPSEVDDIEPNQYRLFNTSSNEPPCVQVEIIQNKLLSEGETKREQVTVDKRTMFDRESLYDFPLANARKQKGFFRLKQTMDDDTNCVHNAIPFIEQSHWSYKSEDLTCGQNLLTTHEERKGNSALFSCR